MAFHIVKKDHPDDGLAFLKEVYCARGINRATWTIDRAQAIIVHDFGAAKELASFVTDVWTHALVLELHDPEA